MTYTGIDDPNLPDEVKLLGETERKLYIDVNNPLFKHPKCQAKEDPTLNAHYNAMRVIGAWQNYHPIIRG